MRKNRNLSGEITVAAGSYNKERDYWLNTLSGELVKSTIPYDYKKGSGPKSVAALEFQMEAELFSSLAKVFNGVDHLLHICLAAGIVLLLYKYTGNRDVIIGAPIYKQESDENFINTVLTLRHKLDENISFKEFLIMIKQVIGEANDNLNYPIETLLEKLNLPFSENECPLFDIAVLLENIHDKEYLKHIQTNILFLFRRIGDGLKGVVEYNGALYKPDTIRGSIQHFVNLLNKAFGNLDVKLQDIDILSEQEKKRLLYDFNNTASPYPGNKTIVELFEEQEKKKPHHIAAVYESSRLTYGELAKRAHEVAVELKKRNVEPECIVGLLLERSLEMVTAIVAVLKAGGAYLPIDINNPTGRIKYLLEDSKAKILLTQQKSYGENFENFGTAVIDVGDAGNHNKSEIKLQNKNKPGDMAYVIYTSGSTGKPKGVIVEHKNVINLVYGLNQRIYKHYRSNLGVCLVAPYFFDASVQQLFAALLLDHCLHIVPENTRIDGRCLIEFYKKYKIDISDGTPTHIRLMLDYIDGNTDGLHIKHLIIGGEELIKRYVEDFLKAFGETAPRITNVYGPTECCVDSTSFDISAENIPFLEDIPIGIPMPNEKIYILGPRNTLLPVGIPGELCISGDGVARGYLGRGQLQLKKFIENPFEKGQRLYKTGDLARWLPDGNILFLGRMDRQVKVRGLRIELGEIEGQLLTHDKIEETVVIIKEDENGDSCLCAYIISEDGIPAAELREYLSMKLPEYMIPSFFVQLENIPLTPNGKIDRKALPEPTVTTGNRYTAPRNEVEKKLVEIWSEILIGIDNDSLHTYGGIGIDDNFFDLGGHSIKATILMSHIHREFNIKVALTDFFKNPTIRGLLKFIQTAAVHQYCPIEPREMKEYYPLSSAQKRLYVLQQMEKENINYNVPAAFLVEGKLHRPLLENTFQKLVERHESLRTSFEKVDGEPVQRIHEGVDFKLEYYKWGDIDDSPRSSQDCRRPEEKIIKTFIRHFDLARAPLLRVGVTVINESKHILLVDLHHIVSDGTSHLILVRDFLALYSSEELPKLRLQYKDYSEWQNYFLNSEEVKSQETYWLKQFEGEIPRLKMTTDYQRTLIMNFEGDKVHGMIDLEMTNILKKLAHERGATLNMILLAIFNILLLRITDSEDIVIGVPIAGRRHHDLNPIIGMFVNMLAVRNFPTHKKRFIDFLEEVKGVSVNAYENQDYQFDTLVEKLKLKRSRNRHPLVDVVFEFNTIESFSWERGEVKAGDLLIKPFENMYRISKFDLLLIATETSNGIDIEFEYRVKLFRRETIRTMCRYFKNIVREVINDAEIKISEIKILDPGDKEKIVKKNPSPKELKEYDQIQPETKEDLEAGFYF